MVTPTLTDRMTSPLWSDGCSALQLFNVLGYIIFLGESSLGGAGRLGEPIGRVSNDFATAITPIGWTFSIWSVIFSLTGCVAVYQALPSRREWSFARLGYWWALNMVIGEGLWTVAFVKRWGGMWVSAVVLLFIVATNAALYLRIDAGVAPLAGSGDGFLRKERPDRTWFETIALEGGIGLYMGWTTAAAILSVSIALVASGAPQSGPTAAAAGVVMLFAASALAVAGAVLRTDFWFSGALAWALAGIRAQNLNAAWSVREPSVLAAANAALAIAAAATLGAVIARARLAANGSLKIAQQPDAEASSRYSAVS
jgi:hypothetical protein